MSTISEVFRLLDEWRHLPAYQLERRVDVFFGLVLPEFFQNKFEVSTVTVIPEFPLNKKSIGLSNHNQSARVDFSVFFTKEKRNRVFLVELKTDDKSIDPEQLCIMEKAKDAKFRKLLSGVISAACASRERRKYAHLIWKLHELGYLDVESGFSDMNLAGERPGLSKNFEKLSVSPNFDMPAIELAAIVPNEPGADGEELPSEFCCVTFGEFADWLETYDGRLDPTFVTIFKSHLRSWACVAAGKRDLVD